MRFYGIALFAGVIALGACGGGGEQAVDTTTVATPEPAPASGMAAGTMAPITGTTHEVQMVGDEKGYRYDPATITAKVGDGIKFIMVSGGPHNVAFDPATIPEDMKAQLAANMPNATDFASPMFLNANETWTLSLGGLKPGNYPFNCTPHIAMGMKGEIILQ